MSAALESELLFLRAHGSTIRRSVEDGSLLIAPPAADRERIKKRLAEEYGAEIEDRGGRCFRLASLRRDI